MRKALKTNAYFSPLASSFQVNLSICGNYSVIGKLKVYLMPVIKLGCHFVIVKMCNR
uniref:Uncharacterized protein n=1 Tax=Tetranychus urticae TaxID=32264 RepID=T1JXG4_TETUR